MPLPREFYLHPDVVQVARDLLGKYLCTVIDGKFTSGVICETEAYEGVTDRASHAYGGRRTKRTEIMYMQGGTAYVYLCYGIHSLFNVVTNAVDIPHAVLIRGIFPAEGREIMLERTGKRAIGPKFGIGPGNVSKAMGIHYSHSGIDLVNGNLEERIWIEDKGTTPAESSIKISARIGVDYAGKDAGRPYRFELNE
jgi:DNA-3-methyladenine glycosylase